MRYRVTLPIEFDLRVDGHLVTAVIRNDETGRTSYQVVGGQKAYYVQWDHLSEPEWSWVSGDDIP